jgi:arylsulfatase A-like enzyme
LIVHDSRLPTARRGATVDAMTLNIDFAPTLLDLAGVSAPRGIQGQSLAPLVRGERPPGWRTELFYEHHTRVDIIPPSEGVRTERWKYLRWVEAKPVVEELYDLARDPGEERNLAGDTAHTKTLSELRARWTNLGRELK